MSEDGMETAAEKIEIIALTKKKKETK